jgi:hypothetical protein
MDDIDDDDDEIDKSSHEKKIIKKSSNGTVSGKRKRATKEHVVQNNDEAAAAAAVEQPEKRAKKKAEDNSRSVYDNPCFAKSGVSPFPMQEFAASSTWMDGYYMPSIIRDRGKTGKFSVLFNKNKKREYDTLDLAYAAADQDNTLKRVNKYRKGSINGEECYLMQVPVAPHRVLKEEVQCLIAFNIQSLAVVKMHAWEIYIEDNEKDPYIRSTHDVKEIGTLARTKNVQRMSTALGCVRMHSHGDKWIYRDARVKPDQIMFKERCEYAAKRSLLEIVKNSKAKDGVLPPVVDVNTENMMKKMKDRAKEKSIALKRRQEGDKIVALGVNTTEIYTKLAGQYSTLEKSVNNNRAITHNEYAQVTKNQAELKEFLIMLDNKIEALYDTVVTKAAAEDELKNK